MVGRVQPITLMVALQAGQTSRPVSAVVQGQDERITRDPAYRTCSTPCWPCWYTHVRMKPRAGYEGKVWARACCRRRRHGAFVPRFGWVSSKQAPQAGPAGHTVPASCGQEPQKARPRLAWPGKRCSPVMGWPGACGKAHSFCAHAQQPCRGPWQVMVYREEGCAHCGDQESSMFRPSQTVPDRWVPQSWLLAH